jgi:two-component system sensor histidine kinase AgrC
LLDNAIEAAEQTATPYISIAFIRMEQVLSLEIENSCPPLSMSLKQIFQQGASTKGSGRGLGLANVNHLISKEKNAQLETFYDAGVFIQTFKVLEAG